MSGAPYALFSLSLKRPNGPIQSLSCNVRLCVSLLVFLLCLITSIYKVWKAYKPIAKRFLREKLGKVIGLRFSIFCSEMIQIAVQKNKYFFGRFQLVAWTQNGICMDAQWNLHRRTTEFAWTHNGICMVKQQNWAFGPKKIIYFFVFLLCCWGQNLRDLGHNQ